MLPQADEDQPVKKSATDKFHVYLGKFAGITAEIDSSDTPKAERTVVKLAFITMAGYAVMALCKAPWYGYAFAALPWLIFLILILKQNQAGKFEDRKENPP